MVDLQKAINYALKIEKDTNALLQQEKEILNQTIKEKDELILAKKVAWKGEFQHIYVLCTKKGTHNITSQPYERIIVYCNRNM